MPSSLFRRETARQLRSLSPLILERYLAGRMRWLSAYMTPDPAAMQSTLDALAAAIEADDAVSYRAYSSAALNALLASGVPPVALLAASSMFHDALLRCLTPDQVALVSTLLDADHERLDQHLSARVRGAAGGDV